METELLEEEEIDLGEGLHERELRELATCACCGKRPGESPLPILWKITGERHGLDLDAVNRQQGLTMMLGGSAELAAIMGPGGPMTKPLGRTVIGICDTCAMERLPALFEPRTEEV